MSQFILNMITAHVISVYNEHELRTCVDVLMCSDHMRR